MINIRYHIVSITAVFLALGIGVALGSTFFDRATVDLLNRNINSAERRIKATNAENERLTRELDAARARDDALIVSGSGTLLGDRLKDAPVVVITAPGVDKGDTEETTAVLEQAGADLRGTLSLRDGLGFSGQPDAGLEEALGVSGLTATQLSDEVYARLHAELAAAGAPRSTSKGGRSGETTTTTADGATTTTTTTATGPDGGSAEADAPDGATPPTLQALLDRDYIRYEPAPGRSADDPILERTGYRYVFVGAPDLTEAQNDVLLTLLPARASGDVLPGTVASSTQEPSDGDPSPAPTVVSRVRSTPELEDAYNTVDDLESFAGLVALVLTLQHEGKVAPGHYGQAEGSSAVLPPSA